MLRELSGKPLELTISLYEVLQRRLVTNDFVVIDFAELNAPPMINYGVVYPQAILIFVVTMLYSVIQPIILIFGSLYFGIGYFVYKYKLLFGACSRSTLLHVLIRLQYSISRTSRRDRRGQ